ncbi:MAG: hypothetical protein ACE5JX_20265 [Acidobacteriota bacterium]
MTEASIAAQLNTFLNGSLSLQQLEDWITSHLQDGIDAGGETDRLLSLADALFIELGSGIVDDTEFIEEIFALARQAETVRGHFPQQSEPHESETTDSAQDRTFVKSADFTGRDQEVFLQHAFV